MSPHFEAIRAEAAEVISRYHYLRFRYPERYTRQNPDVQGDRATFYLQLYGMRLMRNCAFCPHAVEAVQAIPGLATAAIYLLAARSRILPHTGVTDLVLRGHMGLISPPGSYLRIGGEVRGWAEGGFLVFDDTLEHEAWNETDQCRAILLFDFFRQEVGEERRQAWLRQQRLRIGRGDYPWLLAAETTCADAEFMSALQSGPPASADLRVIVGASGMYLR